MSVTVAIATLASPASSGEAVKAALSHMAMEDLGKLSSEEYEGWVNNATALIEDATKSPDVVLMAIDALTGKI